MMHGQPNINIILVEKIPLLLGFRVRLHPSLDPRATLHRFCFRKKWYVHFGVTVKFYELPFTRENLHMLLLSLRRLCPWFPKNFTNLHEKLHKPSRKTSQTFTKNFTNLHEKLHKLSA